MCACLWEILSIGYDASKGKECFLFYFSSCFLPCFPCLKKKKKLMKDEILLETQDSDFLSIIYGEW